MNKETTIFGHRIMRQTLSFDILERKLTSKLGYKLEETLDSRYNEETTEKNVETWDAELRILVLNNTNMELHLDHMIEEDEVDVVFAIDLDNPSIISIMFLHPVGINLQEVL